jgi:hypothetical protein
MPSFLNNPIEETLSKFESTSADALLTGLHNGAIGGSLMEMETSQCIRTYTNPYQTSQGNLIVTMANSFKNCSGDQICQIIPVNIGESFYTNPLLEHEPWRIYHNNITKCWSEKIEEHCTINYSLQLAIIVIVFNFFKIVLFFGILFGVCDQPLITMGDAVSSFLELPDNTTEDLCLMSREDFSGRHSVWEHGHGPRFFVAKNMRWSKAASKERWIVCITLYVPLPLQF